MQKAQLAWRAVSALGGRTTAAIARNSVRATREGRRHRREARLPTTTRGPGRLVSWEPVSEGGREVGARCLFEEAELELVFLAPDAVRLSWGPDTEPLPYALGGDLSARRAAVRIAAEGSASQRACRLESDELVVTVSAHGAVDYRSPGGRLVRQELPPLRRGTTRTLRSVLRPGEVVTGLGEQAAAVDRRGGSYRLWNRDPGGSWGPGTDPLYCSIPVLVGLHPEGDVLVFHENPYRAKVLLDAEEGRVVGRPCAEVTFAGGMLRHYVICAGLERLTERYAELTGRPPLPPRWSLGYHQCRWGYRSEEDVREVADGFAAEGLPLSAVHLDIDYMRGYRVFTVDDRRFPDLGALARRLAETGTRLVTIVDPGIKADGDFDVYREGVAQGRFVTDEEGRPLEGVVWPGRSVFPDFTDASVRSWWSSLSRRLTDRGVAGFWHDMNEPTSITVTGDPTLPLRARHAFEGRGGLHAEAHNVYGLLMDRAGFEALEAARPELRPFVVSRAGWAGVQRWSWLWTGDVETSWSGLLQQVPTLVALGLSGVPFAGPDIGGFSGVPSPELYVRWLELAVFLPFCRTHSVIGAPAREPWRFAEPHRSMVGDLLRLRYRLLPHLYTLAHEAAETGHPVVRPSCWGTDTRWLRDDQWLLGADVLLAPVHEPGAEGRDVTLPPGSWHRAELVPGAPEGSSDASSAPSPGAAGDPSAGPLDAGVAGGRRVSVEAPLGCPVVLVRSGTILALDDAWAEPGAPRGLMASHEPLGLALHCWPDASGRARGSLYLDAGDGHGPWRLEHLEIEPGPEGARRGLLLKRHASGDWPGPEEVAVVIHGWPAPGRRTGITAPGGAHEVEVVPDTGE